MSALNFPVWCNPEGQPVACVEKIKVMHENLEELRQMAQDALEVARGLTNYSSEELILIKGAKTSEIENILGHKHFDEVIHRDDLVIL